MIAWLCYLSVSRQYQILCPSQLIFPIAWQHLLWSPPFLMFLILSSLHVPFLNHQMTMDRGTMTEVRKAKVSFKRFCSTDREVRNLLQIIAFENNSHWFCSGRLLREYTTLLEQGSRHHFPNHLKFYSVIDTVTDST